MIETVGDARELFREYAKKCTDTILPQIMEQIEKSAGSGFRELNVEVKQEWAQCLCFILRERGFDALEIKDGTLLYIGW